MMFYVKIFLTVVIAVVSVLVGYELFNKARTKEYVSAAYLSEGLSASSGVKSQIAMYYHMNEEFPASNQDVGIPPPDKFVGQSLSKLQVSEGGVITLTYNEKSGVNNGAIQLEPSVSQAMGIQWKCSTSSYEKISLSISACEFIEK